MKYSILMHRSTYEHLAKSLDKHKLEAKIHGADPMDCELTIYGVPIEINQGCSPTINEPSYIFPSNRFVTYEDKDREWCEPLGIGRPGIFKLGEILKMEKTIWEQKFTPMSIEERKHRIYTSYEINMGLSGIIRNGV